MERIVDALVRLRNDKTGALSLINEMDRAENEAAAGQSAPVQGAPTQPPPPPGGV